ncbi:glycosyltransferase family 2 protein [Roseitranquillus sediminis]|uniref:glycosyltransferase family 2 protein n=1 Tax=Roseitranquillus sediminis TaxID=2809051 RepID=UPI001D0C5DCF|nr:glycosyltransferase family 2 protein [Roseitranquillus sediminis]MBM9594735.1 glycosyltransferase [Roseitranquillus sediminis]
MLQTNLRLVTDTARPADGPAQAPRERPDLGALLVERGLVSHRDLVQAQVMQAGRDLRLEDVLLAHGLVSEADLYETVAQQWGGSLADLVEEPADARLVDAVGASRCLRERMVPWRRAGSDVVIATSRPDLFEAQKDALAQIVGPVRMAVAAPQAVERAILAVRQRHLARLAELRVPAEMSCRGRLGRLVAAAVLTLTLAGLALTALEPLVGFGIFAAWAVLTLVATAALKAAATVAVLRDRKRGASGEAAVTPLTRMPAVSILVPLLREKEIAGRLIARLSRLDYPHELLDICLVVEEDDTVTQQTIAETVLPPWMRQVVVPHGGVQTKPRALNYALDFCRGSIIGVYDAEDRPDPDQIRHVVTGFAMRGPEVACLQGVLDYYNASQNWLSRCFTIEYAAWFRLVLPGLARLGLVVPLGGTTLFFRRDVLEALGGWDAHNVTEDADLGLRLARRGYRTELLTTVTQEEANCRAWRWVKQRSRWLKGYAMTYAAHMRDPVCLWRDLGAWRFFGVQVMFLGTLSQFALAPVLWSFWLLFLGLPHPMAGTPAPVLWTIGGLFLATEALNVAVAALGVARPSHRWLIPWAPTLHVYYSLGAIAAWKGLLELLTKPFFWDKTQHGVSPGVAGAKPTAVPAPPRPPQLLGEPAQEVGRAG